MSSHLLPVKTGRESFPVKYRNMHPYSLTWCPALTCERSKCLYIVVQAYRRYSTQPATATDDGRVYFYSQNLITNEFNELGVATWEQMQSMYIFWMLVDDNFFYFSMYDQSANNVVICIYSKKSLAIVGKYKYGSSYPGAYGKMQWFDTHTLVMQYQAGVLFFDINTKTFRYVARSVGGAYAAADIAVGKEFIMMTSSSTSVNAVLMYRISDETFSTFSLQTSNVAMCCYANDRFYIANTQALYVYAEYAEDMESIVAAPWVDVRSLSYTNNTFFATRLSSNRVYIYGFDFQFILTTERPDDWAANYMEYFVKDAQGRPVHVRSEGGTVPEWVENTYYTKEYTLQDHRFLNMPWTVYGASNIYAFEPTAFQGLFFLAKETLCTIDYSGNSKYDFGSKYDVINLVFNRSTQSQFTYDPRFIIFTDTYMTMRNGDIRYTFSDYETESGLQLKRAVVHKSDYKKFNYAVMKHITNGG